MHEPFINTVARNLPIVELKVPHMVLGVLRDQLQEKNARSLSRPAAYNVAFSLF